MKSLRIPVFAAALVGVLVMAADCTWFTTGPKKFAYIIAVDSIVVQDTVNSTDTLFVGIRGIVSTDGCGHYDHYTRTRSGGGIQYTVHGFRDETGTCVPTLVLFNKIDTVVPPQVDPTVISAIQPPGAFPAMRTVVVK